MDTVSLRQHYYINTITNWTFFFGIFTFFKFTFCLQVNRLHLQFYDSHPPVETDSSFVILLL